MSNPGQEWTAMSEETRLPASIETAWGLRERPTKGPKPGLSLDRIVAAAVKLAAAEGLAAVSMGRVAGELGASAMSLYRYVASKDELLALMVDAAVGSPPAASQPGEDWRAGLTRWAWSYHEALARHPWVVRVPIGGPPTTPNGVAWMEAGLASLAATGLDEEEKLSVILLLSGYVRNEASLVAEVGAAAAAAGADNVSAAWSRLITRLTDAERFPALHRALASGALEEDDDPDEDFGWRLERVLDGVDVLVRARR
jgi:AcrR family transcriptional regulator